MYILDGATDNKLTINIKLECKKCRNIMVLGLEREVVQVRRDVLGRVGINNGRFLELGGVGFKIGCICNN